MHQDLDGTRCAAHWAPPDPQAWTGLVSHKTSPLRANCRWSLPQSRRAVEALPIASCILHAQACSVLCGYAGPGGFDGLQIAALRAISYSERTAYETGPKVIGDVAVLGDTEVSLTFLDMGIWAFHDFLGSELRESTPGSAALQGLQIMQMLPCGLLTRAQYFDRFSGGQVKALMARNPNQCRHLSLEQSSL